MGGFSHVTESHHAHGLPNAETNARCNTTVEALDTVLRVDVAEGVSDSHLLGTVGILSLALHFDANDLNRLVPSAEATTNGGSSNLLDCAELLVLGLASHLLDTVLSETAETESASPVGHLANSDGVNTLVDTADTFATVDFHEGLESRLRLDTGSGELVFGDFHRLHAGAETHGSIGLRNTTGHTTDDATTKFRRAEATGVVLGLRSDEEKNGALGGGFDPSPGDQTLVD